MGTVEITPVLRHAWQGQAPSITDDEIRILLPIVQSRGSWVARSLRAYRAGRATFDPAEQPLAGSSGCPLCEGATIASVVWETIRPEPDGPEQPGPYAVMWHRCADCDTVYRPSTGEVWTSREARDG